MNKQEQRRANLIEGITMELRFYTDTTEDQIKALKLHRKNIKALRLIASDLQIAI